MERAQQVLSKSPIGRNYVLTDLYVPLYWLMDEFTKCRAFGDHADWAGIHRDFAARLARVLEYADWLCFGLRLNRVEVRGESGRAQVLVR